jgi:glucosamine-6-phosphate deaminase
MSSTAEFTVDELVVRVFPSPAELARAAAGQAAAALVRAVAERGVAHAMFATGNSQLTFVEQLVGHEGVPWGDVVLFHMDEYVGVGPDHPAGFARWIRRRLVAPTRPRAAHLFDGLADPDAECARYARLLQAHPLDLCCLGIGENGHLAFNDPPSADFHDPVRVKVVELDVACRRQQVNEGHFPNFGAVPPRALTVTIPALIAARHVVAIVPGSRKALPVQAALEGSVSTACPASVLRRHGHVTMHLDTESASELGTF